MRGPCAHNGEKNGIPFQISTRPSRASVPTHHLAERGTREHHVPARLADHAVPVAPRDLRMAGRERRPEVDLDPRRGPAPGDLVGVQLGATGLGIVEVAPRQEVDPRQTC